MKNLVPLFTCFLFSTLIADELPERAIPETVPSKPLPTNLEFYPKNRGVMCDFFGEALFLQPNGSSIYYAVEAIPLDKAIAVPAVSPNWEVYEISPNYSPAFNIGTKILFSDVDTSISANWERLFSDKHASHTVGGLDAEMIGPIFDIGPNVHAYTKSTTKAKFHFDTVNLTFAQRFSIFNRFYPNIFTGGSFARIKQRVSSTYSNSSAATLRGVNTYSTFTGAGPKVGLDFDYRIVEGFFFNTTSSVALIIGESQNGTTFESKSPNLTTLGIPQPNVQHTTVPNRTQLIPAIEERIGFSYGGIFYGCKLTLGFGYQAQIYIDAVQTFDMTAPQVIPNLATGAVPDDGVYAVGFERTLSNFMLTGPYLSLGLDF